MLSLRSFWSKHKRKILVSCGVLGSGYVLYKLYDAHTRRISQLEKELECQIEVDELIKAQLQALFENIQRVSDTITLPYAMSFLRSRISKDLDLTYLTEKLMQSKGQNGGISTKEKIELWDKLKILSFTKLTSSLWSTTMLCLYVRVQVTILGRHLYLENALGSAGEAESVRQLSQQDFLATADYLATFGIDDLLMSMEHAAMDVLKEKQLREPLTMEQLYEIIIQILESFMNTNERKHWISYLMPENATSYRQLMVPSVNVYDENSMHMDVSKLDQLIKETHTVLSSSDFKNTLDISLRRIVDVLIEDINANYPLSTSSGIPLAKLLPRVAQMVPSLLEDPSSNKYIEMIRSLDDVQLFYTLLYSNLPTEQDMPL